jgi:hypothetical protein
MGTLSADMADLETQYRHLVALLERSALALDRQDLTAVEAASRDSGPLLEAIRLASTRLEQSAWTTGSDTGLAIRLVELNRLAREALAGVTRNQNRLACWLEQTQGELGVLSREVTTLAGYAGATGEPDRWLSTRA